jgi:hypothetical protein
MRRGATVSVAAAALAAIDLATKALVTAPAWALHQRSHGWVALSLVLLAVAGALAAAPARASGAGATLLVGGVLGNLVSALAHGLRVPNPLVVGGLAFTLADVFVLAGLAALVWSLAELAIRYRRHLLPPRRWERALLRRLSG